MQTVQCRGRTCNCQTGPISNPASERTFLRCRLPSLVPLGGFKPKLLCVASEGPSLAVAESTLPRIPERMLIPCHRNCASLQSCKSKTGKQLEKIFGTTRTLVTCHFMLSLITSRPKDSLACCILEGVGRESCSFMLHVLYVDRRHGSCCDCCECC